MRSKAIALLMLGTIFDLGAGAESTPNASTTQRADYLFRLVVGGPADKRPEAIEQLYEMLNSTNAIVSEAVRYYGYEIVERNGTARTLRVVREQSMSLLGAIPHLIEALDGHLRPKAYRILIAIQGGCPPAKEFGKWWVAKGREEFLRSRGLKDRE